MNNVGEALRQKYTEEERERDVQDKQNLKGMEESERDFSLRQCFAAALLLLGKEGGSSAAGCRCNSI